MQPKSINVIAWTAGLAVAGFILGSKQSYALDWHNLFTDKPVVMGTGIGALLGVAFGAAFSHSPKRRDGDSVKAPIPNLRKIVQSRST